MGKNDILSLLSGLKGRLMEKYGITALGVFGSVTRDQIREGSDVDVEVRMKPPNLIGPVSYPLR